MEQLSSNFQIIETKSDKLVGERGHDSENPDDEAKQYGIEMIAPRHGNGKKPRTPYIRRLRRHERPCSRLADQTLLIFAWIQRHPRLLMYWEYYADNLVIFIQRANISILFKKI